MNNIDFVMSQIQKAFIGINTLKEEYAALNVNPKIAEAALQSQLSFVKKLIEEDYPFAYTYDKSDLVFHIEAKASQELLFKLVFVRSQLDSVDKHLNKLVAALIDLKTINRTDRTFSGLEVSNIAKGSLLIGLKVPERNFFDGQTEGLLDDDPVLSAVRESVNKIKYFSRLVSENDFDFLSGENEDIDPYIGDASLIALKNFSPSDKSPARNVTLMAKDFKTVELDSGDRKKLLKILRKPMPAIENITISGEVRAIDLDDYRVTLKNLDSAEFNVLRVRANNELMKGFQNRLEKRVTVSGKLVRDKNNEPRLLQLESVDSSE